MKIIDGTAKILIGGKEIIFSHLIEGAEYNLEFEVTKPLAGYELGDKLKFDFTISKETNTKPVFIPLKKCYFEAFENGTKIIEIRKLDKRWSSIIKYQIPRKVVLSCGYGRQKRLFGFIVDYTIQDGYSFNISDQQALLDIYGRLNMLFIAMKISLNKD